MLTEADVCALPVDDYMNPSQLEFFKARLQIRAVDLRDRISRNRTGCEVERHPDEGDFASDEEARSMALKMIARDKVCLDQVLHAMELIRLGDYGFCHETGEPIGVQRLLLVPESIYSVESMRVLEARGRHQQHVN